MGLPGMAMALRNWVVAGGDADSFSPARTAETPAKINRAVSGSALVSVERVCRGDQNFDRDCFKVSSSKIHSESSSLVRDDKRGPY
jgi:hypothetical protein